MTAATRLFSLTKTKNIHYLVILFLFSFKLLAQNDTIFFNPEWKTTVKDSAIYYRLKPTKIKTKKAIGRKIQYVDSLYVIKDYYVKNNTLQFEGYTKDVEGNNNVGKAKWFKEDGTVLYSRDFNKPAPGTFRVPRAPITYLNYSIADKSLLTAGYEFCLDCKTNNKLFLGIGYGVTNSYNGQYYGLPDLHLSRNVSILFAKIGTTHKNGYIMGGLSLMNFIDLGLGYSLPYNPDKAPAFEGFTMSLNLRFTKNRKAYSQFMGY
ncbi:hypothetical protein [Flavobacterium sp. KACC 22763]|uniref:hypothetical protein n=1 Tax=Flavobacterium sp. KACC 22763 TaxID=3025668 RepID=UPI002365087B|nr:hypothetical protein [Flavobacterium sp. KACC 22763]WDF64011.1 hypothetical protein PQ463_20600 [Flavobacterium sp. KACC 22763]